MFTRRLPVHLIASVVFLGAVASPSAARAEDKGLQIGKGIYSPSDGKPNGTHHQAGRIAQVSWAWDNEQGRNVLWAGASDGGLWKAKIDASGFLTRWVTITDNCPGSHALGSFAIRKGDSNDIVIGTGALGWSSGNGIYYTVDAGKDWLPSVEPSKPLHVSRIVADRLDSTGATLVAATSDGIWKTFDFGKNWFSVLAGVEATDVVQDTGDTGNPTSRWYAGVAGQGMYRSTDYATTWAAYGSGITGTIKRISLAASESEPEYLYALVTNDKSRLNGVYRSDTHGSTWAKITPGNENEIVSKDGQGGHASAIVCDPADPAHVFFGIIKGVESKNATASKAKDVKWGAPFDGGHTDFNFLLFHEDGKHLHIANDGGYYYYDIESKTSNAVGNLLGINAMELGGAKTTATYSTLQGGLASSWSNPDVFVAGLQDNGVVRGDVSTNQITFVAGGDGRHVSIMPADDGIIGFNHNGGSTRNLLGNGPVEKIDFNLPQEKSAPVLIDPTPPGLSRPLVFTAAQNLGTVNGELLSGVYVNDVVAPDSPWSRVGKDPIFGLVSNVDVTANSKRYEIVVTTAGGLLVSAYEGPRSLSEIGTFPVTDITPPLPYVVYANPDARINADRSTLQPDTLYYTSGKGTPRLAFVRRKAAGPWVEVTGDIVTKSGNANLLKLIGNPKVETEYFLATSKGVFRGARGGDGKVCWTDYSEGLRDHEDVEDIVINYDKVSAPTLYIATHGRGFWRRTVEERRRPGDC